MSEKKICRSCKLNLPTDNFYKDRRSRGVKKHRGGKGVGSVCKECQAEKRNPELAKRRRIIACLGERGLKQCTSCDQEKPFRDFSKSKATKDGHCHKCKICSSENSRKWRKKNPDSHRVWYENNKSDKAAYWREWYDKNAQDRRIYHSEWAKENKAIVNALIAKRNARKRKANPPWANQEKINWFYEEAKRLTETTGIKHEVDHIYPLQGELCCGLHVENNLQILTKTENLRKSNRMPVMAETI